MRRFQTSAMHQKPLPQTSFPRSPGSSKARLIKILAAIIATTILLSAIHTFHSIPPVFGLIIDAGSTGSRIHTYVYHQNPDLSLHHEDFHSIKPGLSHYATDPRAAAASLIPLLDRARTIVPRSARSNSPIVLRATAGLRMIGEEAAENVLREVRTVLQNSGFRFQNDWASILVGSEESLYSWLTVNYLLKRADTSTVGTLEMGGGSSQIAFVASRAPVLAGNCSIAGEDVDYEGSKVSLYTASHSNFGLQKARSLSLLAFESEGSLKENPCINEGKAVDVEVPFEDGKIVSMTGRGDFAKCKSSLVKALVKPIQEACDCDVCSYKGVSRPKPIDEYIAIAFYLERTISIGMVSPITAADIRKKGEQICNMSVDQVIRAFPDVPNGLATDLCMDLAFISMHLDKAHGVTEDVGTKLMVMNKINGFELGWCLGAMQQTMDKLYSQS